MSCPNCDTPLPSDAPAGLCPQCLMQAGMAVEPEARSASNPDQTTSSRGHFVAPAPEFVGELFPQLEILELLGRGGMGAVYKARQPSLDRLVAIKILPPEIDSDPAFAERFAREARALGKLNHPSIVSVFDFGQIDGQFYLVMEYVDGVNLRDLINRGEMEPEEALAIVPQICEALQYAHSQGVVHRDIKPENVLVDRQGRVKIADFGLAKLCGNAPNHHSITGTHQVMGTPHYMAPEQMHSSRAVDHRADIYSVGVVLYEMLTGELPLGRFEVPSKKAIIDVRLDEVVLRALENTPERRYQHVVEVKSDIEAISHSLQNPESVDGLVPRRLSDDRPLSTDSEVSREERHDPIEVQTEVEAPSLIMMVLGMITVIGHLIAVVISLQEPNDAETAWIGVPGLVSGLLMIMGGLSLRSLWSSGWAYLGAIAALLPVGPGWLITAFVGIWVFNILARPHIRSGFTERRRYASENRKPIFSRKAILGAFWAPLFPIVVLGSLITTTETRMSEPQTATVTEIRDGRSVPGVAVQQVSLESGRSAMTTWQLLLLVIVLPLGLAAPFGTTILGLIAIADIRREPNRIAGMPLALADALGYPLLLLDGLIFAAVMCLIVLVAFMLQSFGVGGLMTWFAVAVAFLFALPICAAVDFLIVRAAWKRATSRLKQYA